MLSRRPFISVYLGHTLLERYGMTEIGMALSNPLHGSRLPVRHHCSDASWSDMEIVLLVVETVVNVLCCKLTEYM